MIRQLIVVRSSALSRIRERANRRRVAYFRSRKPTKNRKITQCVATKSLDASVSNKANLRCPKPLRPSMLEISSFLACSADALPARHHRRLAGDSGRPPRLHHRLRRPNEEELSSNASSHQHPNPTSTGDAARGHVAGAMGWRDSRPVPPIACIFHQQQQLEPAFLTSCLRQHSSAFLSNKIECDYFSLALASPRPGPGRLTRGQTYFAARSECQQKNSSCDRVGHD